MLSLKLTEWQCINPYDSAQLGRIERQPPASRRAASSCGLHMDAAAAVMRAVVALSVGCRLWDAARGALQFQCSLGAVACRAGGSQLHGRVHRSCIGTHGCMAFAKSTWRVAPLSLRNNLLSGLRPQNPHLGAVCTDVSLNTSRRALCARVAVGGRVRRTSDAISFEPLGVVRCPLDMSQWHLSGGKDEKKTRARLLVLPL